MAKQQTGFFRHVHHDIPIEYCYSFDERVSAIKRTKPKNEIRTRLRLFKPVRGRVPVAVRLTAVAEHKAMVVANKAWLAHCIDNSYRGKTHNAWLKTITARNKAERTHIKALAAHKPELEALHDKECGCSEWDGTELVFPAEKK